MDTPRLDLNADILPSDGLGGLKLRVHFSELEDIEGFPWFTQRDFYYLASPCEVRYRLGGGEIEAAVDVRNGKVFKLLAYRGYSGKLFGKIYVGMPVKVALEIEPRLFYDEAEEAIFCQDVPGLVIDIPEIDPPPKLVPDMFIDAISVFAPEAFTLSVQEGKW